MKNIKRIISIICVILMLLLIIATFIASIFDNTPNMGIFKGLLACTIFVPIISFVYICFHKYAMNRSGRKDYYSEDSDS